MLIQDFDLEQELWLEPICAPKLEMVWIICLPCQLEQELLLCLSYLLLIPINEVSIQ